MSVQEAEKCAATPDPLDAVTDYVSQQIGLDFRNYNPEMVRRRITLHMHRVGAVDFEAYLELLKRRDGLVAEMVRTVTIKVSRFFRNPRFFSLIRDLALPALWRESRPPRIWTAGCGYGEEAYSLAILLEEMTAASVEQSGTDGSPGRCHGVKTGSGDPDTMGNVKRPMHAAEPPGGDWSILASDVDESALARASAGVYAPEALAHLSPKQVSTHFHRIEDSGKERYRVSERLRKGVSFVRHDLTSQFPATLPSGGEFDFICCRNVLIYFRKPQQERTQRSILDCLRPGGYLWLGESEWLTEPLVKRLKVIDGKARLFQKV